MKIEFNLNNSDIIIDTSPFKMLVDVLRINLGLTGTKKGCGSGNCGSCLVFINNKLLNSCLVPVFKIAGTRILTIEGFSTTREFHSTVGAFQSAGVTLCGFCAPGIVMAAEALILDNPTPSAAEIKTAISGNNCRCIGYHSLVNGILEAARRRRKSNYGRKK